MNITARIGSGRDYRDLVIGTTASPAPAQDASHQDAPAEPVA